MTTGGAVLAGSVHEPGRLMRLVAGGLSARGLDVRLPEWEDSFRLRVTGPDTCCDLAVCDCGCVEWDCSPRTAEQADPKQVADIVTALLTSPAEDYPRKGNGYGNDSLTFKAIVAMELKARGLSVDLDVYADETYYDAYAVIVATNPATGDDAKAIVSDQGEIIWERHYRPEAATICWEPQYSGGITNPEKVAAVITDTVCQAMILASAGADDENG